MGLDMYLVAKVSVSGYKHDEEGLKKFNVIKDLFPEIPTESDNIMSISLPVGYWRKANHIHAWFVENVQNGEDDCREYYVSQANILALKEACEKFIAYLDTLEKVYDKEYPEYYTFKDVDGSKLTLHHQSGFFFGNTEYDSWSYKDVEYTLKVVNNILPLYDSKLWVSIYYQSSW